MNEIPAAFTRTTCTCEPCVQCCRDQPGPLAPGDLERIATFLGWPVPEALRFFWASPGAVVKNTQTHSLRLIGTITPQRVNDRCVFLDSDDRCTIHAVSPFGCAYADMHMSSAEWQRRATWLYTSIEASTAYRSLRAQLVPATSWNPRP